MARLSRRRAVVDVALEPVLGFGRCDRLNVATTGFFAIAVLTGAAVSGETFRTAEGVGFLVVVKLSSLFSSRHWSSWRRLLSWLLPS